MKAGPSAQRDSNADPENRTTVSNEGDFAATGSIDGWDGTTVPPATGRSGCGGEVPLAKFASLDPHELAVLTTLGC